MTKKIKQEDNSSNQQNNNKGTSGQNDQNKAALNNKANQKNPNHSKTKS